MSVGVKASKVTSSRYGSERRAKANLPITRRNPGTVVKTRGVSIFWDKSVGCLIQGRRRPAYRGRESDAGFYAELQEPVAVMIREKPSGEKPQGQSTEAQHWDGSTRRSVEDSVMELEQRGRVRLLHSCATGNRRKLCVQQSVSRTL